MADQSLHAVVRPVAAYRLGDFVVSSLNSDPVLLEVIGLEADGSLRVRAFGWAPGHSAVLASDQVRYVTSILAPM